MKTMMQGRRRLTASIAVAVASLALAACGGSDDGSDKTSGSKQGGTIKVMTIYSAGQGLDAPQTLVAVRARVKAINAGGGINGKQIELSACNTKTDPNVAAACARQAVKEKVVAVVGSLSFLPTPLPILERANIPWIGGFGITPEELTSKISFPVSSDLVGWAYGMAGLMVQNGSKRPSYVTCAPAACQFGAKLYDQALKIAGVSKPGRVTVPDGQSDVTAQSEQAVGSGTDGISLGTTDEFNAQFIRNFKQSKFSGPVAVIGTNLSQQTIEALGKTAEGTYVVGGLVPPTSTDNEAVKKFLAEMKAEDPGAKIDELASKAWAATDLFFRAASSLSDVTPQALIDLLNKPAKPIDTGIAPPFVGTQNPPLPEFSRLGTLDVSVSQVKDGKLVQVGDGFVDPMTVLRSGGS